MCQKSVETRTCAVQDCKLQHVAGTNRAVTEASTSEPTDLPSKTTAQIKSNKKGSNNKKQPQTQVQNSFLDERLAMMEEQIKNLSSMETRIMQAVAPQAMAAAPTQRVT